MKVKEIELVGKNSIVTLAVNGYQDRVLVMLSSDLHIDNMKCDQKTLIQHLEKAKEEKALIIMNGDIFDAMENRRDPRGSTAGGGVRPEVQREDYADALVDYVSQFLMPYRDNILLIGEGNHETAFQRHYGTSLTARLVHRLNEGQERRIIQGGYSGYVIFKFAYPDGKSGSNVIFKYHHGAGGSSPVTKGSIDTARKAAFLSNCHVYHFGHKHQTFVFPVQKEVVTRTGVTYQRPLWFVQTAGYKKMGAWAEQKGFAPAPRGCAWMEMQLSSKRSIDLKFWLDIV